MAWLGSIFTYFARHSIGSSNMETVFCFVFFNILLMIPSFCLFLRSIFLGGDFMNLYAGLSRVIDHISYNLSFHIFPFWCFVREVSSTLFLISNEFPLRLASFLFLGTLYSFFLWHPLIFYAYNTFSSYFENINGYYFPCLLKVYDSSKFFKNISWYLLFMLETSVCLWFSSKVTDS